MSMLSFTIQVITGIQPLYVGMEPVKRQRIYYANHTSNLDGLFIWACLPKALRMNTRPVAARDYWSKGIRRLIANRLNPVLVDRKEEGTTRHPLEPLKEALDEGDSLIIFPEGGRSMTEALLPFKGGLYHLARDYPEVDLTPVYLNNIHRILPKGEYLPVPIIGQAYFGAPLPRLEKEKKPAFLARAREVLSETAPR